MIWWWWSADDGHDQQIQRSKGMARDQLPGFKQNLEIGEMEEKDTKTQRGWQLDDFFEGREELCGQYSWRHIREGRVTKKGQQQRWWTNYRCLLFWASNNDNNILQFYWKKHLWLTKSTFLGINKAQSQNDTSLKREKFPFHGERQSQGAVILFSRNWWLEK